MPNFEYKITRSKRRKKTTTIRVRREGTVEVMVPHTMRNKEIEKLLEKKEDWVTKKLTELKHKPQKVRKNFTDGELFCFLGKEYPLVKRLHTNQKHCNSTPLACPAERDAYPTKSVPYFAKAMKGKQGPAATKRSAKTGATSLVAKSNMNRGEGYLSFNQQQFIATIPLNWKGDKKELRRLFINWYKNKGAQVAKKEVDPIAKKLGVTYKEINLKEVKTLWGSCTPKKRLNFNWKIALAPFPVFRYIIIHETCHLKIPGHNKKFWRLVESFDPSYKKHRKWLKENSWQLSI